jgi:hypothetical protein
VPNNSRAALTLAACVAVGCTGIVYGSHDSDGDERVTSTESTRGNGGARAGSNRPDPASSSADGAEPNGAAGAADEGSQNAGGVGGAEPVSSAPGGETFLEAGAASVSGTAGSAGEASSAAGSGAGGASHAAGGAGGSPEAGAAGHGGASDGGAGAVEPLLPGSPLRGSKLVTLNKCYGCHGSDLSGKSYYRNLTPDFETGLGKWTDEELAFAIRAGFNAKGEMLCAAMPIYSGLTAQGLADMVAFLRSIPPKKNEITLACPGHDP